MVMMLGQLHWRSTGIVLRLGSEKSCYATGRNRHSHLAMPYIVVVSRILCMLIATNISARAVMCALNTTIDGMHACANPVTLPLVWHRCNLIVAGTSAYVDAPLPLLGELQLLEAVQTVGDVIGLGLWMISNSETSRMANACMLIPACPA